MSGHAGRHVRAVERIGDAREADERVLDHLASLGCDPVRPLESTHYLYFATDARADAVAAILRARGWTTAVGRSEGAWLLTGRHVAQLTSESVRECRVWLETLTSEHGGLYDGWEARI
ncbi:MAG TPA: ribonuclease E inhibitor RraB [Gaiellaceae bacterium]|nr:ribonuclease E inhibitor RraB [Gaiellaceae bacterium]